MQHPLDFRTRYLFSASLKCAKDSCGECLALSHHDAAELWCLKFNPAHETILTVVSELTDEARLYRVDIRPSGWRIRLYGGEA